MKTPVRAAAAAMAALALCACGHSGASDSGTASTAASASQPSTSKDSGAAASDGMMTLLPTGNLVIQVPGDAVTGTTTTYDDGMQQTYYDSRGSIPLTVAVEYYAGAKPAASILAAEQQALTAQSIQPKVTPVDVPGGSGANRLDWQTTAIPPWLQDRKTSEVPITCAGIIVDGPGGESYGVYVFADPKNKESLNRMSSVLTSVAVSAS